MKIKKKRWKTKLMIIAVMTTLLFVVCSGIPVHAEDLLNPTEVSFGALLDLSGNWSSLGESSQAVLLIAVEDINNYLSEIQSRLRIKLIVEDTAGNPLVALKKLKNLSKQGVKVVIGPQSSAEVKTVKDYVDKNNILIISQGSTAHSLALPNDNIFRFCPDDVSEGKAMAALMWEDGIRVVVPMWRGDTGNDGLHIALKNSFEARGGSVFDGVRYDPTIKNFSEELVSLNSKVEKMIIKYAPKTVAIYLAAFNEAASIFNQAYTHLNLSEIRWYGSNGVTLSSALIENPSVARFAIKSGFLCPIFGLNQEAQYKWESISKQIKTTIKRDPDAFTLAAYDALWVATLTHLVVGDINNFDTLKIALIKTANSYFGASGWTALNEEGDREFANYDFWVIKKEGSLFRWEQIK